MLSIFSYVSEVYVQVFWSILKIRVFFLLLNFTNHLYILGNNLVSDMPFANIFSQSVAYLLILLMIVFSLSFYILHSFRTFILYIYVCIYMYIYVCMYMCITYFIYIYYIHIQFMEYYIYFTYIVNGILKCNIHI